MKSERLCNDDYRFVVAYMRVPSLYGEWRSRGLHTNVHYLIFIQIDIFDGGCHVA